MYNVQLSQSQSMIEESLLSNVAYYLTVHTVTQTQMLRSGDEQLLTTS